MYAIELCSNIFNYITDVINKSIRITRAAFRPSLDSSGDNTERTLQDRTTCLIELQRSLLLRCIFFIYLFYFLDITI